MYDVQKALKKHKEEVYHKISDYDIFSKYIPGFKVNNLIRSPLRDDSHPSFSTYRTNNSIRYRDFSTGDNGNAIEFVKKLFKLADVKEAYAKIKEEFVDYIPTTYQKHFTEIKNIGIVRQKFTKEDLAYWESYNISKNTLERYDVFSIKNYLVNGEVKGIYTKDNPMYAYKVYNRFKIYRPLADKLYKWRQNLSNWDIQGFSQLDARGELLIITKSLKDVMVLRELGYNAIAPPSESAMIPSEVIQNLTERFTNIILLYDRDKAGMTTTRKMMKQYNLDFFFIDKKYKVKDISDFIKLYGKELTKQFLDGKTNKKEKFKEHTTSS